MFVRQFKLTIAALLSLLILPFAGCGGSDSDTGNDFLLPYSNFDAPVRLAFQTVPMRVSGTTFSAIQVAVLDYNGKVVTTADNAITIALANPGGATLMGTLTRNAVNGIATFDDLSVDIVGTYTFVASSPGLLGASSTNFEITPASPAQLTFPAQPGDINSGDTLGTVQVEVRDAQGNLVDTQVNLTLQAVSGSGTLGGTTSQATTNGVASFSDLTVTGGGTFTLQAAVSTGAMAASNQFAVSGLTGLLFVDSNNRRIINTSDFVGTGFTAYDGTNTGSVLDTYLRVSRDSANRIYICDYYAQRIIRVDDISGANPVVLNLAFNAIDTAVDSLGRIYVSDFTGDRLVRYDDMAGTNEMSISVANEPEGLEIDSMGRIYVAQRAGQISRMDDIAGTNRVDLGGFTQPKDVAVDSQGRIYVANGDGEIVRVDDMAGTNRVSTALGFDNGIRGVDIGPGDQIYVADSGNRRAVRIDDMAGTNFTTYGSVGTGVDQFNYLLEIDVPDPFVVGP